MLCSTCVIVRRQNCSSFPIPLAAWCWCFVWFCWPERLWWTHPFFSFNIKIPSRSPFFFFWLLFFFVSPWRLGEDGERFYVPIYASAGPFFNLHVWHRHLFLSSYCTLGSSIGDSWLRHLDLRWCGALAMAGMKRPAEVELRGRTAKLLREVVASERRCILHEL